MHPQAVNQIGASNCKTVFNYLKYIRLGKLSKGSENHFFHNTPYGNRILLNNILKLTSF